MSRSRRRPRVRFPIAEGDVVRWDPESSAWLIASTFECCDRWRQGLSCRKCPGGCYIASPIIPEQERAIHAGPKGSAAEASAARRQRAPALSPCGCDNRAEPRVHLGAACTGSDGT